MSSRILSSSRPTSDSLPAGHGVLKVVSIDPPPCSRQSDPSTRERTQISFPTVRFSYPLKLIVTRSYHNPLYNTQIGLVYLLNYGGGLVSGDQLAIEIELGDKCHLLCLSQGSTKVYKEKVGLIDDLTLSSRHGLYPHPKAAPPITLVNKPHQPSRQNINARIGPYATLLMLPSYVTCFRDSSFTQKQTYHLQDHTSSLVCLDWFTSGRAHSTRLQDDSNRPAIESWTFKKFQSFIEVFVSSKRKVRDNLILSNQGHYHQSPGGQSDFTVYANLYIVSSTENLKLVKVFDRLKDLDRANKTQPHKHRSQQQAHTGTQGTQDYRANQIIWCFSELNHPPSFEDHPPLKEPDSSATIADDHTPSQKITHQIDDGHRGKLMIRIGIVRIGSSSTVLVREWLEKNLVDLGDLIGPEFYNNCF